MAYNQFNLEKVQSELHVSIHGIDTLFQNHKDVKPSSLLVETLKENVPLAIAVHTEKARSELIVSPILVELRRQQNREISLFSGTELNVDKKRGLMGRCDFIISLDKEQFMLSSPIITLVEAKRDNITNGYGQCIAEMVGAKLFNENHGKPLKTIYGVITTGSLWKFLKLQGSQVFIENREVTLQEIDTILGVLTEMIEQNEK